MPSQTARLELRIAPENKELIELAAKLKNVTITTFVTEVVLAQARAVVHGPSEPQPLTRPRPIGGWDFEVPLDFDEPLEDMADYL